MSGCYDKEDYCIVGVGKLSVPKVKVGEDYQLEDELYYAQRGYYEIESV